jgi:putative MATE family efflux protein
LKFKDFILLVKRSIKGDHTQDFTSGNLKEDVILLAIPMILELSLESVFAVVDIFFVSKLGASAIATVGLTESVITLVYSCAIGLSTAVTALVARRVGEKNYLQASQNAAQSIMICILLSIIMGVLGVVFARDILEFMGASADTLAIGVPFTKMMMASSLSIMLLFMINGIFRGAGDAAMAMRSLWIASIINIVLCPIFIHFYGLIGAAYATTIGRSTGVLYQLYHLKKGQGLLKFIPAHFVIDWVSIKSILSLAWPATFQFIIASGSWIFIAKIVAETGGTDASAGYQIAIRNVVFFILPAWGLSNAAATLVGQNLGAKLPERAEQAVYLTTKYNVIFMAFVTFLFILLPKFIIGFFTQDPILIAYGSTALRIIGVGYIFYGIAMVMMAALNGAGDTKTPTWINIIGFWLIQIPLAYILSYTFDLKSTGAFWAIPIAETIIALIAYVIFKRGKWKTINI